MVVFRNSLSDYFELMPFKTLSIRLIAYQHNHAWYRYGMVKLEYFCIHHSYDRNKPHPLKVITALMVFQQNLIIF